MENTEIYNKVETIIKARRLSAITENDIHIDEINRNIPEISEINNHIINTGKELVKIIMSKGNDIQEKIAILKQNNIQAQEMIKNLLIANNLPEDYLDIHYTCDKCNDTGYFEGNYCECFHHLYKKIVAESMNNNSQMKLSSFDTFKLKYYTGEYYNEMKELLYNVKKYADEFSINSRNLLMLGETGLGKTHLSLAIAKSAMEKGYNVIYDSAINIFLQIEKEHFGRCSFEDTLSTIMETQLLIIDDLGTEHNSPFYTSVAYNIINTRLNKGFPTIISTNLDIEDMSHKYNDRVKSRIVAQYVPLKFVGKDVRLQIAKGF